MKLAKIASLYRDFKEMRTLPELEVRLMLEDQDPSNFYVNLGHQFYRDALSRHPKMPLMRRLVCGVAICELPAKYEEYFMKVEGSARRNYRKADRKGYTFRPIDYNANLEDVQAIRRSTSVRQGDMPKDFLEAEVQPHQNPDTALPTHDYPFFGVFHDEKLVAYAGCLISGELCMIEHIYGHAEYQNDGVVPRLIMGIAEHLYSAYPSVRFYGYLAYYGALPNMRRFKRKLQFHPHKVRWLK